MNPLLSIRNYQAHFYTRKGVVRAVDGISYDVYPGETLAIVGESGSGKSVSQLSYLGLLSQTPLRIIGGEVLFHQTDLLKLSEENLRKIRGDKISMVFQEPMTSLNPYLKIGTQLIEPLLVHRSVSKSQAWKQGEEALERVGIADHSKAMHAYPHEFSGGMRQRVMIAMALTTEPEVLIADEPTTALDVTVQSQILELLSDLQKQNKMAVILITHDLGVVAQVADRVVVMYAGKVFETGSVEDIFYRSQHPYTQALLRSTPRLDKKEEELPSIPGSPPPLFTSFTGCPFYERCYYHLDECKKEFPPYEALESGHSRFCYAKDLGSPSGEKRP